MYIETMIVGLFLSGCVVPHFLLLVAETRFYASSIDNSEASLSRAYLYMKSSFMVQNLKIAESRIFIFEAFRLTLFKRIRQKESEKDEVIHFTLFRLFHSISDGFP